MRKLSAVLFVDAVGSTAALAADERSGLDAIHRMRTALLEPIVAQRGGRLLKWLGDGALILFPTSTAAVAAAVEIQKATTPVTLRVGVHVGEVEEDDTDVRGIAVHIAARLEGLAKPSGICISDQPMAQLEVPPVAFIDCGPRTLKRLAAPMRVWHWPDALPDEVGRDARDLPRVMVSLFASRSSDPEDDFLAEGLSEDLISRLSRSRGLALLSRYVTFQHEGPPSRQEVRDMGAAYLVEGSVARAGARIRVSARLTDVVADRLVWSDRFDGEASDLFDFQDATAAAMANAIEPEVLEAERSHTDASATVNLSAWQTWQRGLGILWKYQKARHPDAIALFRRAIEMEEDAAPPHAGLAYALVHAYKEGVIDQGAEVLDEALEQARIATSIDPNDPFSFVALGRTRLARQEYVEALAAYEIALDLNPSQDVAHMGMAYALCMVGRPGEALDHIAWFDRLMPAWRRNPTILTVRSFALSMTGRYEEALEAASLAAALPNAPHWAHVAAALANAQAGRADAAARAIEQARKLKPDLNADALKAAYPFADGQEAQETMAALLSETEIFRPRIEALDRGK